MIVFVYVKSLFQGAIFNNSVMMSNDYPFLHFQYEYLLKYHNQPIPTIINLFKNTCP